MKQPPYFRLTEVDAQAALWAGLLFMLLSLTLVSSVGRSLSDARSAPPAGSGRDLARALQLAFARESSRGLVDVSDEGTHVRLTVGTQLLFTPQGTDLTAAGRQVLDRVARALKAARGPGYRQIQIEGHAPAHQTLDSWLLSSRQAVGARHHLAAASGLDSNLFPASAYGDSRPEPALPGRLEIRIFLTGGQP